MIFWPFFVNFWRFFWWFFAVLLNFWPFRGIFKANFCLFFKFTGRLYVINNHIPSSFISPKYSKCQFRHFACLYIYIFMFYPTLLVPVEGIMTMIRAIKTDHNIDPEWSRLGFHVVLDITLTCLYFATYILEFKIGFDHGLQLVNDVSVFSRGTRAQHL